MVVLISRVHRMLRSCPRKRASGSLAKILGPAFSGSGNSARAREARQSMQRTAGDADSIVGECAFASAGATRCQGLCSGNRIAALSTTGWRSPPPCARREVRAEFDRECRRDVSRPLIQQDLPSSAGRRPLRICFSHVTGKGDVLLNIYNLKAEIWSNEKLDLKELYANPRSSG